MRRVICIGAGQLSTKKANNRINRRNQYLNYGLLSLASVLRRSGLTPVVIHGHSSSPTETLETARGYGLAESDLPISLSVPSFYAEAWARAFILEAKALLPSRTVIVGGGWVVGNRPELLKAMLPEADLVVPGLAEERIAELITGARSIRFSQSPNGSNSPSVLDYSLLHRRERYQPSIEIARGCGMGCSFCQERDDRLQPLKSPDTLAEELQSTLLDDCAETKIKVKANILLYAGENEDTIAETLDWLDRHRECIYGVSVSPVIVFGWPNEADAYLNSLAQFGATRDHSPCAGVTHIKLSEHVNFEDSLELARMISRRFMSADRHYALKSFSYFPRDYRFKDFLADMVHETDSHSFSTECLGGCPKEVMGLSSHALRTDPMDCQVS
ncbi:MAG: hypothetical protein C0607_03180 [Azoarcus sp.]|nr:MAG: hypothetical protein C0607_03180 [Azoarcus sp.]